MTFSSDPPARNDHQNTRFPGELDPFIACHVCKHLNSGRGNRCDRCGAVLAVIEAQPDCQEIPSDLCRFEPSRGALLMRFLVESPVLQPMIYLEPLKAMIAGTLFIHLVGNGFLGLTLVLLRHEFFEALRPPHIPGIWLIVWIIFLELVLNVVSLGFLYLLHWAREQPDKKDSRRLAGIAFFPGILVSVLFARWWLNLL